MSIDRLFFIGFGFFVVVNVIQLTIIRYRIRKTSATKKQDQSQISDPRLTPKETFFFGLFQVVFRIYLITWGVYLISEEKISLITLILRNHIRFLLVSATRRHFY